MASFSTLPSEILSSIVELVLLDHRPAPESIESAEANRLKGTSIHRYGHRIRSWDYGPRNVRHEHRAILASSTPLLCVNKAVNEQTKAAIGRLFPNGMCYALDALFVNETELWPTWLSVPALSTRVHTVDTTIRVIGYNRDRASAFQIGDGSPEQHVWLWFWLLEQFLGYGPVPATKESLATKRRPVIVQHINIDVGAANDEVGARDDSADAQRKWRQAQRRFEGVDDEGDDQSTPPALHPKWLAETISWELRYICSVEYHASAYGMHIIERVGGFRLTYDGDEELHTSDLGQLLADMFYVPDANGWQTTSIMGHLRTDCRITTFWNWKIQTMRSRRENGLPVPDLEDAKWPTLEQWREWRARAREYQEQSRARDASWVCNGEGCYCEQTWLEDWLEQRQEVKKSGAVQES